MLKSAKSVIIPTLLVLAFLIAEADGAVPEALVRLTGAYVAVCAVLRLAQMIAMTRPGFVDAVMRHQDGQLFRLMSVWQPRFLEVLAVGSLFIVLHTAGLGIHAFVFALSEILAPMAVAETARRTLKERKGG